MEAKMQISWSTMPRISIHRAFNKPWISSFSKGKLTILDGQELVFAFKIGDLVTQSPILDCSCGYIGGLCGSVVPYNMLCFIYSGAQSGHVVAVVLPKLTKIIDLHVEPLCKHCLRVLRMHFSLIFHET